MRDSAGVTIIPPWEMDRGMAEHGKGLLKKKSQRATTRKRIASEQSDQQQQQQQVSE
jgi:hypothetical protein